MLKDLNRPECIVKARSYTSVCHQLNGLIYTRIMLIMIDAIIKNLNFVIPSSEWNGPMLTNTARPDEIKVCGCSLRPERGRRDYFNGSLLCVQRLGGLVCRLWLMKVWCGWRQGALLGPITGPPWARLINATSVVIGQKPAVIDSDCPCSSRALSKEFELRCALSCH